VSLWFELHVGRKRIGVMEIIRITNVGKGKLAASAISVYKVEVDGREVTKVSHRYGDGPWTLARKALDAYDEAGEHYLVLW
jgi:hypothetical protein